MAEGHKLASYPGTIVPIQTQMEHHPENTPFTFINQVMLSSADDEDAFLDSWAPDAQLMKAQSGLISVQLYRGCPDEKNRNNVLFLMAVWESVKAFQDAASNPELHKIIRTFPSGTNIHHCMTTKVAVPGVCTA